MAKVQEVENKAKPAPAVDLFDEAVDKIDAPALEHQALPEPPAPGQYGKAAPYNHAPVWLTDGKVWVEAQWQVTRRAQHGRWRMHGFWAQRNAGGRPVAFEPIGWKAFHQ